MVYLSCLVRTRAAKPKKTISFIFIGGTRNANAENKSCDIVAGTMRKVQIKYTTISINK